MDSDKGELLLVCHILEQKHPLSKRLLISRFQVGQLRLRGNNKHHGRLLVMFN